MYLDYNEVVRVLEAFYEINEGDEATTDMILAIGCEILDVSQDKMLEVFDNFKEGNEYEKH